MVIEPGVSAYMAETDYFRPAQRVTILGRVHGTEKLVKVRCSRLTFTSPRDWHSWHPYPVGIEVMVSEDDISPIEEEAPPCP